MITLITPPALKAAKGLQMQSPNPPIGTAYLAGVLKRASYPYYVIDSVGEGINNIRPYQQRSDLLLQGLEIEEIVARIPSETKYIGLSIMFSTLWPISLALLAKIRARFPEATIIGGGEHVTAVPEYCLRSSEIDLLVLGEGESTLLSLLKALDTGAALEDVAGIAFIDKNDKFIVSSGIVREKNIDGFPRPDWDSIPIRAYIDSNQQNGVNRGRSMPMLATRGCPYKCTFCSNVNMYTARWVPRDAVDVVDEMESYIKKYEVENFNFQDLTAFVRKNWIVDFCKALIERNLNVTWQLPSGTRSEVFDEEVADLIYKAGCRNLAFAPESGDEEILESVQKQVDLKSLERAAKIAVKRGLHLSVFIVIGFPLDTHQSMKKTKKFLRRMALIGVHDTAVSKFVPYPGSPLFKELQAAGKIALDQDFFLTPMDFYTSGSDSYCNQMSSKELHRWMLTLFFNFYIISFVTHPVRTARICLKALLTGHEETRFAKFLRDKVYTRTKWLWRSWSYKRQNQLSVKAGEITEQETQKKRAA